MRRYLADTRRECDWQDRVFLLELTVPSIPISALEEACAAEPEAADLSLLRCVFFSDLALRRRGTGTCDQLTGEKIQGAAECIGLALDALKKTVHLDAEDPTPVAYIARPLTIFNNLAPVLQQALQRAISLAPDLVPAYRVMVTAASERWGGSHKESVQFARSAMEKSRAGSDMAVCLFWAHLLVLTHLSMFDKNPEKAKKYSHNPEVNRELAVAFDRWIQPPYMPRRSSIPYLHHAACWFYLAGDRQRLQKVLGLIDNTFSELPWSMIGSSRSVYGNAVSFAAGMTPISPKRDANWLNLILRPFSTK